eukprot:5696462-Prymnesium_polylepis.2
MGRRWCSRDLRAWRLHKSHIRVTHAILGRWCSRDLRAWRLHKRLQVDRIKLQRVVAPAATRKHGMWGCGSVGQWASGSVGQWVSGSVVQWVSGSVGLLWCTMGCVHRRAFKQVRS